MDTSDGHVGRVERGFAARYSLALRATALQGAFNQGHDQGHEGEVYALGLRSALPQRERESCLLVLNLVSSAAVPVVMAVHFCVVRASASALGSRCHSD
jgi:hypothetical protein